MKRETVLSSTVGKIAWGYILLYFDINLGTLDLLPAWLGYLLFFFALPVVADVCPTAGLLRGFAAGLTVWNGITWLFGSEWAPVLVGVLVSVVSLYFHFQLLTELADLAEAYDCPQQQRILTLRTVNTVLQTLFIVASLWLEEQEGLAIVLLIVNLLVLVWICVTLFGLRKALRQTE